MSNASPYVWGTLMEQRIPHLTPERLTWLAERAADDSELAAWLSSPNNPVDVALRAAHESQGILLPSGRVIAGLVVPKHSARQSAAGGWVSIGAVSSDSHFPDAEPVDLMWSHGRDARIGRAGVVGKVLRLEHNGLGLVFWGEVSPGPQGDEILRSVAFGEIGSSVGLNQERALVVQGDSQHRHVNGLVSEISLCPLGSAALGDATQVSRARLPYRPPTPAESSYPTTTRAGALPPRPATAPVHYTGSAGRIIRIH